MLYYLHGALAQLGARHIRIVEAVGSNPICSTTCNTNVRKNEMNAEILPLFRPVKNAEPKILNPQSKKDNE